MLQLLQPSWLFALAGISVPVIIHLWNQRPGRILKVGSTALVPDETKEYKRSLQLSDLLLLLLRCLLIAILAIVLANPVWKGLDNTPKQKGWILIPKENFNQTYSHFKPTVDSLYKAGFEFHYFNKDFAKEKLEDAIATQNDSTATNLSYWKLAESLDAALAPAIPVYIFTNNFLKNFSGSRPVLSFQPNWQTYTPPIPTTQKQIENKDTSALSIAIFTDKYSNDARYIKAALEAVQFFSKKNMSITSVNNGKQIPSRQDWLFWLSDLPLNSDVLAKNIFYYVSGKPNTISSVINFSNDNSSLPLYKTVKDSLPSKNELVWADGFGNPVLSRSVQKEKKLYSFFTHFDPTWNELVWNDNFPGIIYSLLAEGKPNSELINDTRLIDQKQLQPGHNPLHEAKTNPGPSETTDISGLFWLLALILFFAERMVSFYNTKLKTNE